MAYFCMISSNYVYKFLEFFPLNYLAKSNILKFSQIYYILETNITYKNNIHTLIELGELYYVLNF